MVHCFYMGIKAKDNLIDIHCQLYPLVVETCTFCKMFKTINIYLTTLVVVVRTSYIQI